MTAQHKIQQMQKLLRSLPVPKDAPFEDLLAELEKAERSKPTEKLRR